MTNVKNASEKISTPNEKPLVVKPFEDHRCKDAIICERANNCHNGLMCDNHVSDK